MTDWSKPVPVDDVTLAFPAPVIGKLLPPVEDIPKEFFEQNKWTRLVDMMFAGTVPTTARYAERPEINYTPDLYKTASRQWTACLRSFEPKHEHKIAGVAYLLSLFLLDVEFQ